jgi:uncharacterized cupredoxin-like copper-binding protein
MTVAVALGLTALAACGGDSGSSATTTGGGVTAPPTGGTVVKVTLNDTDGTNAPQTLKPDTNTAAAGDITFTVSNTGTIDHEMVVLKTDTAFDQLEVGTSEADRIDEASSIGETGDPALKPGETRSFTLKAVDAGKYVLVCNIAKHYGLGMRAPFTVT